MLFGFCVIWDFHETRNAFRQIGGICAVRKINDVGIIFRIVGLGEDMGDFVDVFCLVKSVLIPERLNDIALVDLVPVFVKFAVHTQGKVQIRRAELVSLCFGADLFQHETFRRSKIHQLMQVLHLALAQLIGMCFVETDLDSLQSVVDRTAVKAFCRQGCFDSGQVFEILCLVEDFDGSSVKHIKEFVPDKILLVSFRGGFDLGKDRFPLILLFAGFLFHNTSSISGVTTKNAEW